jgi:hypothetical protein
MPPERIPAIGFSLTTQNTPTFILPAARRPPQMVAPEKYRRSHHPVRIKTVMIVPNPSSLRATRALLVQKYLANPAPWPDGIDWGSHWYRDNKPYWDALAKKVDDRGRWLNPQDDPILHPEGPPKPKPANSPTQVVAALKKRVDKRRQPVDTKPVDTVDTVDKPVDTRKEYQRKWAAAKRRKK